MSNQIKTKKGLLKVHQACSSEVQSYFEHLPKLLDEFPLDVALAYAFARLELGQNMALYCGVVKVHRADGELARKAVSTHHMSRDGFLVLYKTVFGFGLPKAARQALKTAEDT